MTASRDTKSVELMNGQVVKMFKDRLCFRRMESVNKVGLIHMPDSAIEECEFAELIAVGPDCMYLTQDDIGAIARLPDWDNALHRLTPRDELVDGDVVASEDWCMKESDFINMCGCLIEL